ncbi:MAG: DUF2312 domain-containing protein [Pseudomonadota bacterium]
MADTSVARDQLRTIIERIERLEEEKKAIADDIRDVFAEAKGNGFDVKTLRTVVRMRKMEASEREEQEAMLDLYLSALGMLPEGGPDGGGDPSNDPVMG